jgi:hypothetical protein
MNVAELIQELQKHDPNLIISVLNEKDIPYYTDSIYLSAVEVDENYPWEGIHHPLKNKKPNRKAGQRLVISEDLWGKNDHS